MSNGGTGEKCCESATPIKVAVRVRPFSKLELHAGAKSAVSIDKETKQCTITNPTSGEEKVGNGGATT
eukprot:12288933-Ditylum_brightwellii.AAC.1